MRFLVLVMMLVGMLLLAACSPTGNVVRVVDSDSGKTVESVEIKGSDTLLQLVSNLAEAYSEDHDVRISVTGGGSGTGISSLINGEIDIADSSRPIKQKEIEMAADKGIDVWEFRIARDMLSVIVNPDNPVEKLTVDEISKIYKGEITNWQELGGPDLEITLYGRQSTSGTYVFFMEEIVQDDYSPEMRNMEGNQAILEAVALDSSGIGYVGVGYVVGKDGEPVDSVKILDVSDGGDYLGPFDKGDYPISRPLYQYIAGKPDKESSLYDFLIYELSNEGQEIVRESGFFYASSSDVKNNEETLAKI